MYQIEGDEILFNWLSREPDQERRQAMLDWFWEFARDPKSLGSRIPGKRAPVYLAPTRVAGVAFEYLVADPFHTIKLIKFWDMP
jgi:hypothetical protein